MKTVNIPMTTQEMMAVMTAIGRANIHPDADKTDKMVASWVADRIERAMNALVADKDR